MLSPVTMMASVDSLFSKLRVGLARNKRLPPSALIEKVLRSTVGLAAARLALRGCDVVGPRARSAGWTHVENRGRITIGADFTANCEFCAVELRTEPGGVLTIGDQVMINFGTLVSATSEVRLGDGVSIGPYCILCDSDVPPARGGVVESRPIVVEDGAWLAGRVTLLPGAHVGAGAVISAGSIVSGYIPPGTVASGVPARPLRVTGPRVAGPRPATPRDAPPAGAPLSASASASASLPRLQALLLTDFPASELAARLREGESFTIDVRTERYAPPKAPPETAPFEGDLALVWTTAQGALPSLGELLSGSEVPLDRVLAEVDAHAQHVAARCASARCVVVPTWVLPPELRTATVARALAASNARLAERLAELLPAARVPDASRWCAARDAFSAIMEYSAQVPFSLDVFSEAVDAVQAALRAARGEARTTLVLEAPPPEDAASRAAREDLDSALAALRRRGVAVHLTPPGLAFSTASALGVDPSRVVVLAQDIAARARARASTPALLVPEIPPGTLLLPRAVRALRAFGDV